MSYAAVSKCPFLSRVSKTFLQHSGSSLDMYGQRCPVMAKLFHTTRGSPKSSGLSIGKAPWECGRMHREIDKNNYIAPAGRVFQQFHSRLTASPLPFQQQQQQQMLQVGVGGGSARKTGCPFRAALQAQGIATSSSAPAGPPSSPSSSSLNANAVPKNRKGEGPEARPTTAAATAASASAKCKCYAAGLKPRGTCMSTCIFQKKTRKKKLCATCCMLVKLQLIQQIRMIKQSLCKGNSLNFYATN